LVRFEHRTAAPGQSVRASGSLPDGLVRLCVVPNGSYPAGGIYSGPTPLASKTVTIAGGTLPLTKVWDAAQAGSYDLVALDSQSSRILAADDSGPAAGLTVSALVPGASRLLFLACLPLLALAHRLGRRKKKRE
jgi:hypothetical protein